MNRDKSVKRPAVWAESTPHIVSYPKNGHTHSIQVVCDNAHILSYYIYRPYQLGDVYDKFIYYILRLRLCGINNLLKIYL